jgi:hypothetical protein
MSSRGAVVAPGWPPSTASQGKNLVLVPVRRDFELKICDDGFTIQIIGRNLLTVKCLMFLFIKRVNCCGFGWAFLGGRS